MTVHIDQKEATLPEKDLKKKLINSHLQCQTELDNRTDYLVEVYKVARFFFLSAFSLLVLTVGLNSLLTSPDAQAKAIAIELRADTNFVQSIRGEKATRDLQAPRVPVDRKAIQGRRASAVIPVLKVTLGRKAIKEDRDVWLGPQVNRLA